MAVNGKTFETSSLPLVKTLSLVSWVPTALILWFGRKGYVDLFDGDRLFGCFSTILVAAYIGKRGLRTSFQEPLMVVLSALGRNFLSVVNTLGAETALLQRIQIAPLNSFLCPVVEGVMGYYKI